MASKNPIVIIGGGLVGLATAYQIRRQFPDIKIHLLEKEATVCQHQSGHNSGVIHSGIYYKPNSLKAINCRKGKKELIEFCDQHHVQYKILGKLIVATETGELPTLTELLSRGRANGVQCSEVDRDFIKSCEPHVSAIRGIYVPEAGIIDYPDVAKKIASILLNSDVKLSFGSPVVKSKKVGDETVIFTEKEEISCSLVINCAGLYSDKVAKILGSKPEVKIIPFRGEYYDLKPEFSYLCKIPIYPVPNMNFPFLGVHFTQKINGGIECGPNAVLAMAREGYSWRDINPFELVESITYSGFLKLAAQYWQEGWMEFKRSLSKKLFTKALQRIIPEIREEYLIPGGAGVRAQAVDKTGKLVDDFKIQETKQVINVINAPSPGATSCFNIGRSISEMVSNRLTN